MAVFSGCCNIQFSAKYKIQQLSAADSKPAVLCLGGAGLCTADAFLNYHELDLWYADCQSRQRKKNLFGLVYYSQSFAVRLL